MHPERKGVKKAVFAGQNIRRLSRVVISVGGLYVVVLSESLIKVTRGFFGPWTPWCLVVIYTRLLSSSAWLSLFCQARYLYSKENLLLWENDRVQCDAIMMVRMKHQRFLRQSDQA